MVKKVRYICIIILLLLFSSETIVFGQCNLTTQDDSLWICEGDCVDLISTGGCPTYMMNNDFNNGTVGTGWTSNCSPMFNNPCLPPVVGGNTYLWIGDASTFPRSLTTVAYAVTNACRICFDMAYAIQSASSPCEGPDLPTEGVHLQYSINGGVTWIDINYWDPLGGYDPQMTTWNNYCEDIPVGGNVQFQWWQDMTSGNTFDHWGLDNVQIFCPPPQQMEWWTDASTGVIVDTGFTTNVCPTITTTYIAHVDDSIGSSATDQTVVNVFPTPTLTINNLNTAYCLSASAVTLTGNPAGGDFSGPGITGNSFDPAAAGVGIHDIVYHLYHIAAYTITGNITIFEDDFATDLGWTGYGAGGWDRNVATMSAGCSGSQDPSTDNTPTADNFIIGNYIGACYPNNMAQYWLTSPIVDCSGMNSCFIDFYSHSGIESPSWDHLNIDAYDGATWQNVYTNAASLSETAWTNWNISVSAQADNNPNFKVRFGLGTTDGSVTYKGWNIDDFRVICDGTLNITDTLCDFTTTQTTEVIQAPISTFTLIDSVCVNSNTIITYTGTGTAAGTYNWNFAGGIISSGTGQGPYELYWTTAGTYDVTLTVTEFGCTSVLTTVSIIVLPMGHPNCCVLPTPNAGADDGTCSLTYDLQAIASATSGLWSISSGPGNATFNPNNSATASVTVDQYGDYVFYWLESNGTSCNLGDSVIISFYPDPQFDFTSVDLICNNVCQGEITVNPLGTTDLPYTYLWDANTGNQTGQTANNLCAGTFNVIVTNTHFCTSTNSATITEPTQLITISGGVEPLCYNGTDGYVNVTPSGGTPNYTYLWDSNAGNQLNDTAVNLAAGTYCVVITDANLCTISECVTIGEPTQLTTTTSFVDVLCFGGNDGSATVIAQGGTGNYYYQWDPTSQTTQTADNLIAGTYSVIVTDANGCTSTSTVIVSEPASPLSVTLTKTDALCFGSFDGTVDLTVAGGTTSYSFLWNSTQTTEDLNNIPAGTYCVTVIDANFCTISDCITINEPTQLTYTTSTSPTTCFEGSDGIATVNVANGTPPYTYLWSNGDMVSSAVNISAGTYTVIVTDNNGCSFTTNMTVNEPDRVMASTNADMWICIGETATLNAAATGGTPGYTFHWSNGQNAQSIDVSPVTTTQYCVYAEDISGCISANYCVNVNVYQPISTVVTSDVDKICPGEPVTISVVSTGGNGNYIYILNNSNPINPPYTDYPIQSLSYTVTTSDDCGSPTDFGTVSITVLPMPPNSFAPNITAGCQPFTVQFIESSSDMGQTYSWNFDDENSYNASSNKNPSHIFEYAGVYDITLTVTDTNGCINVDVVEDLITVHPKPVAKFEPDPEIASVIKPVIYFNNLTIGAVDYHWFFGDGDSSLAKNPYHIYASNEQTYIVELKVESDKGCQDIIYTEVRIKDEYTFYAPTAFSPDGDLTNDEFFVVGHGIDERNFELIIYNRWGEIIFQSNDPNAKWDGKVQGKSKICDLGTYTWLAIFKDIQGSEHAETGAVTIIR